mmetsp:Transcript_4788/g.8511  ORF Transcript_4788/g.8511 Transcript_4788/m.8511 type:complete len:164 (-) Transcript_4788:87-578(-)|eukprot:CAMPEP_0197628592 /NCGR_PEP_ID=MMETSP1338-20131121/6835_1 /TAXON_ID=43686 ORGANISM="Pelagodinium beii, Strain RCC1491" /NCGR_SAMPLE_ID=MMETSP1338 /ASSEMBLY_ACC=CAM_ASM_000754 /LENGTH=163 /DNA_ID=CAMNT_0043199577 /DNA_START=33 /DNA_END=524 /DNA_ORIENTATION=-
MGRSESRSRSRGRAAPDEDEIQDKVDERQQARRDRDFGKADRMRDELKDMGVRIDDTDLKWEGPEGMRGYVNNPGGRGGGGGGGGGKGGGAPERRDGDWDCPNCGKLVFASKLECFSCGTPKGRGGDRDRRRRDDDDDYDRDRRRRRDDYSDDDYDRDRRRRR